MSAIFYGNEEQKKLAVQSRDREAARRRMRIVTEISPLTAFTLAEDYHQKYYLRQYPVFWRELSAIYPTTKEMIGSTAAARLNGYAGGHGNQATLEKEIKSYGLSPATSQRLLAALKQRR